MNTDEFDLPAPLPVPALMPMWSVRWLVIGPLFGWAIGMSGLLIGFGGWWTVAGFVVVVGSAVGLATWAKWMVRANLLAVMSFTIVSRLCGPVAKQGATVTIYPAGEGMGMVEVVLPPKEEPDGD